MAAYGLTVDLAGTRTLHKSDCQDVEEMDATATIRKARDPLEHAHIPRFLILAIFVMLGSLGAVSPVKAATCEWTGGTMSGSGITTITDGATLTLKTTTFKSIGGARQLRNAGSLIWQEGDFLVSQSATSVISNTGTFEMQTGGIFGSSQLATTATFINSGTLIKTGTATTTVQSVLTFNNQGLVDIQEGALILGAGATSTSSGIFQVADQTVLQFERGNHILTESSQVKGPGSVRFVSGNVDINGSYAITGLTTVNGGNANFNATVTFIDLIQNGGFLSLDSPNISIVGTFTHNGGSFDGGTGMVLFKGDGDQDLVLNAPTPFNNLAVAEGTRLIETVAADNATINGTLTNEGVIRKSETITLGANSFGLTGVQMDVTALGTLSSVQVDRVGGSHPQANAETATGEYWNISPTGTGFTLDLTLPHNLADSNEAQVCRFTGTGWDCDADAATDNTVTRNQITGLSDWAIGRIVRSGSHLSLPLILNLP